MKEALKLTLALGLICVAASTVLVIAHNLTRPAQEASERAQRQEALRKVLPSFDNEPLQDAVNVAAEGGTVTIYPARREGELVGLAAKGGSPQGYGGKVEVLVGATPSGEITSVVVTSHNETPGLGTQATERKRQRAIWDLFKEDCAGCGSNVTGKDELSCKPRPGVELAPSEYLDQYGGLNLREGPFQVTRDGGRIDAVSGATVSSRAVADAVSRIAAAFKKGRERLLQERN